MLPLWIVDLRTQSDRRDHFVKLLGQIDHVYMADLDLDGSESCDETHSDELHAELDSPDVESTVALSLSDKHRNTGNMASTHSEAGDEEIIDPEEPEEDEEITVEERIDACEKKRAEREAVIEGYWWRYSPMGDRTYGIDIIPDTPLSSRETAEKLYKFQSDLVKEGQDFIRGLRKSNAHPDIKINVIVLGDIEEDFTRIVFPSVAGLLQKEKGKILPHHIHQGMEIIGMLYIPSNINALKVTARESMQRTLNEIDVQHRVADMRGYDHMMLYQDVQNRTQCFYPALDNKELQEYLFQCIVNLYLASDETHPLLSGTASADIFYFSMGATSVCYDVDNEDLKARHEFGINFMRSLKKVGDDEYANIKLKLLDLNDYDPSTFFDYEAISHINNDEIEETSPRLHPIKNFYAKYLKRYYYNQYLRNFTSELLRKITSNIDNNTRGALEILASASKRKFKDARQHLFEKLKDMVTNLSSNEGGLPTIIEQFKKMQDGFSEKKKSVQYTIKTGFWNKIEDNQVPRKMKDKFIEYHEAYEEDIRLKNGGVGQNEMKKEATKELNDQLSQEATMLSRICRGILLGIMLALAVVPILNIISPQLMNLGRVRRYAEWWSVGLFCLPVLIQFISWFRYERKKRMLINNLKALYLHDAYARVANRIESEINSFYDKMIALGNRYIKRAEDIRDNIEKDYDEMSLIKPVIPETIFNQSLLGGKFGRDALLPIPDAVDTQININYIPYKIGDIRDKEFFLFMNEHHNMVMELFEDVELCENIIRRTKPDGEEELVTKEQQEKEQEDIWKKHLANFHENLSYAIKDKIVPRINASVGEILVASIDGKVVSDDVLEIMVDYAASNGEFTSSGDMELMDVKINEARAEKYILPYVATTFKNSQVDRYNYLYQKYIFVTRWRCFEQFSLNRILPMEDFDEKIRTQLVYEEEKKAKNQKKESDLTDSKEKCDYFPYASTLLLWALSPDDSSAEWFRIIDSAYFREALEDKDIYKEILNQND